MIAATVIVHVDAAHIHEFIDATVKNHESSVMELGNLRFDILQSENDPSKFMLYEAWADVEAAKAHKESAHYKIWRDRVASWMVEPRQSTHYTAIRP
jgi:autoinducer 2-degrading protein